MLQKPENEAVLTAKEIARKNLKLQRLESCSVLHLLQVKVTLDILNFES